MEVIDIDVVWEADQRVDLVAPPAQKIAGVLLGLEETYRVLATTLGYPPHFLKVKSLRNLDLKLSLEGGKEAIDALRELILAVPRLIASLFRPQVVLKLADQENEAKMKELEAQAASADANRVEAEARRLRAELEKVKLQQELASIPIRAAPEAHAVLREIATTLAAAEPTKRIPFIGQTARYLMASQSYEPSSRIVLVPRHRGSAASYEASPPL